MQDNSPVTQECGAGLQLFPLSRAGGITNLALSLVWGHMGRGGLDFGIYACPHLRQFSDPAQLIGGRIW